MLLDPFEEKLHLPTALVKLGDGQWAQGEVIGEEDQIQPGFRVEEADPAQVVRIIAGCTGPGQADGLIADHSRGPVGGAGIQSAASCVDFGSGDEKGGVLLESVEPLEVEIPSIHDIDSAGLEREPVQDAHIVDLPRGDLNERGDVAVQVQQRVDLDRGLGAPEIGPGEQRQAQIDGGGIQGVHHLVQVATEGIVGIQGAGDTDQLQGEGFVDPPIPVRIGVSQGVARDRAVDAHVVKLFAGRAQAQFDVAQAFPIGQLSEGHAEELVPARKGVDAMIPVVFSDTPREHVIRDVRHQLREDTLADVHKLPLGENRRGRVNQFSNRCLTK